MLEGRFWEVLWDMYRRSEGKLGGFSTLQCRIRRLLVSISQYTLVIATGGYFIVDVCD
jgi:hypothetical protein